MTKRPESNEDRVRLANGEIPAHLATGEMTLQERLRDLAEDFQIVPGIETETSERMKEAADALDAKDKRIKELEGALRDMLECLNGCMVFITTREKIKEPEGHNWISEITQRAREALK